MLNCIVDGYLCVVQNDISSLVAQLKDLQKRNAEFEDDNMRLSSKVFE